MARLRSVFLLAALAFVANMSRSTAEGAEVDSVLHLVQVTSSVNRGHTGDGSGIRFISSPSNAQDFQPTSSERWLSRVTSFRAASGGNSSDDTALFCAMIIAIVIGVACLSCILHETTSKKSDDRGYDNYASALHPRKGNPASSPFVRHVSEDMTSLQQPQNQFHGSPPESPQFQSRGQSNMQLPSVSASSPVQDSSALVTQVDGGMDIEHRPQAKPDFHSRSLSSNSQVVQRAARPATSLPGRLTNTNSLMGSEHHIVDESATAAKPKPLCNSLVLNVASRFLMHFDHLDGASADVPIFSETSSKVLLLAHVDSYATHQGGSVSLGLTESYALLGTIKSTGSGFMRITDRSDNVYGDFKYSGNLVYTLFTGGEEIATLNYERGPVSPGKVSLTTMSGARLAEAFKRKADRTLKGQSVEYLEVKVDAGVDPVLALLCIFGAMVLG